MMTKKNGGAVWLLGVALSAGAVDLTKFCDLPFAEEYAFSTNRAALLEKLPPDSEAKFFYSVLLAQQEGRLDDARALLKRWKAALHGKESYVWPTSNAGREATFRSFLLDYAQNGNDALWEQSRHEFLDGLWRPDMGASRKRTVKPGQYPSVDTKACSACRIATFSVHPAYMPAFLANPSCRLGTDHEEIVRRVLAAEHLDLEWAFQSWIDDLKRMKKEVEKPYVWGDRDRKFLSHATLAQMDAMRAILSKEGVLIDQNEDWVWSYARKLAPSGEPGAELSASERVAYLERLLAFAKTLPHAWGGFKRLVLYRLLDEARKTGDFSRREHLLEYLAFPRARTIPVPPELAASELWRTRWDMKPGESQRFNVPVLAGGPEDDSQLVRAYLLAVLSAGADRAPFEPLVEANELERLDVEARLLSGRAVDEARVRTALGDKKFRAIRDRRELTWDARNPAAFAADDDVTLRLQVKNVPSLRVAVYDIDPAIAVGEIGAEVPQNVDLDGATPTAERTLETAARSPLLRQEASLPLPELKKPGLYVVEASGGGLSSRALVRKGVLRAAERVTAAGHRFTVYDEKGRLMKDVVCLLDGRSFVADETGAVTVPFSETGDTDRKAVLKAGRRATITPFRHRAESFALSMQAVLPAESFIAGEEASLLLRAGLTVCGAPASLSLLEKTTVKLVFADERNIETSLDVGAVELRDDRDVPIRFWVPANIRHVRVVCEARVRKSNAKADARTLAWSKTFSVNGFARSDCVQQVFLRRGADGYRVEVRGRQGEPLAGCELTASGRSRFGRLTDGGHRLQTDADGAVRLGFLKGVANLFVYVYEHGRQYEWTLDPAEETTVPSEIHAVAGETIEINAAGCKDADLPSRDKLAPFVSLLERNTANEIVRNRLACVREGAGGALFVEGLPAGRYELRLRTLEKTIAIRVTAPADATAPHGWLVNGTQCLSVTPASERPLRIAEAVCTSNGTLRVRLANASPETRLHVFARHFIPRTRDADVAADYLKDAATPPVVARAWDAVRSSYLSNRDLGDELTYILNRRKLPPRFGNDLSRPSLLLTPWYTTETDTQPIAPRMGEDWKQTENLNRRRARAAAVPPAKVCRQSAFDFSEDQLPFLDFLAEPAKSWLNCPLSEDGVFELPFAELGACQEIDVLASDTRTTVRTRVCRDFVALPRRDLRHVCRIPLSEPRVQAARVEVMRMDAPTEFPAGASSRYRTIATLGDAFALFQSLEEDPEFAKFSFVCTWSRKSPAEKDDLYRRFVCHELDVFLSAHDPAYFKSVVRPHLRNKRDKDFVDRWLLGEDLSAFVAPAACSKLDVFEQALLAMRVPAFRPKLAAALRDAEAVKKRDPADEARLFQKVISASAADEEDEASASCILAEEPAAADASSAAFVESPFKTMKCMTGSRTPGSIGAATRDGAQLSYHVVPPKAEQQGQISQMARLSNLRETIRRDAASRTKPVAFRKPLEKTREWVETGYWKRRPAELAKNRIGSNRFWADAAAALCADADGRRPFLSVHLTDAAGSLTERLAALAFLDLPFEAKKETRTRGADGVFSLTAASDRLLFRDVCERVAPGGTNDLAIVQRLVDPRENANRSDRAEGERTVFGDLRAGKVYEARTALVNPTGRARRISLYREIPEGAIPLAGGRACAANVVTLDPYGSADLVSRFYFPYVSGTNAFRQYPSTAGEAGRAVARAAARTFRVTDRPAAEDKASWDWISQNGTNDEVLDFVKKANLNEPGFDLGLIRWRMADGARGDRSFNEALYRILDDKMFYDPSLWVYATEKKDMPRVKEYLERTVLTQHPQSLGRFFESPVVSVRPEETGLFELKEYAPLINARIHPFGRDGRAFANAAFAAQYRSFLDLLAYKPALDDRDRLLAAVYLLAQDRVDEATAFVARVRPADVETKLQYDYAQAWLAMSTGRVKDAKKIAEMYRAYPVKLWRERFAAVSELIAEVEHLDSVPAADLDDGGASSGLALRAVAPGKVSITSRALKSCTLTAHPVDLEVLFSRNPFLTATLPGRALFVRPVWEMRVKLSPDGNPTAVALPKELARHGNLLLVATAADGAVRATLAHAFREPDVRILRAQGRLLARDGAGRPLAGAYVKVYARPAGGSDVRFHKDGYTDLRGAFDYASVSTEHPTPPGAFAVFVSDPKAGGAVVPDVPPPSSSASSSPVPIRR